MIEIFSHSIKVILDNQASSGAYPASPNFPTYHYCWFRDSSFISYAMDLVGRYDSASRFHDWAATCINNRPEVVHKAKNEPRCDIPLHPKDYLHARYNLDGSDGVDRDWPNFQLDGFGTWLWSLGEHLMMTGKSLPPAWEQAADQVANYLTSLWRHPCYDCWEEYPDKIHLYSLAAIYGGLKAHARFANCDHQESLQSIVDFVLGKGGTKGYFVKFVGSDMVDASLLGLATPYRLVEPDDPLMVATATRLEQSLIRGGGVHRYPTDSYYGGGEWVLLAGWLGWYYSEVGKYEQARVMLEWMERQADSDGFLPEQVPASLNNPTNFEPWIKRWGPVAIPLLWSHAKYIILDHYLSL